MNAPAALSARLAAARLDWIVPDWPAPPGVGALSTTRAGGISTGARASLDLGCAEVPRSGAFDRAALAENRRRLDAFLPAGPVWLEQCHGTDVALVEGSLLAQARETPPRADAAVTRERGTVLAVLTADCLPVVLADRQATSIGIAHAGWRGLAAGVVEATAAAMAVDPDDIVAWLGPAIGPGAFEVGADVVDAFCARNREDRASFRARGSGKWLADLTALAQSRLARMGVRSVHGGGWCTFSDPARFYSYRRQRDTGRMATLVWLAVT